MTALHGRRTSVLLASCIGVLVLAGCMEVTPFLVRDDAGQLGTLPGKSTGKSTGNPSVSDQTSNGSQSQGSTSSGPSNGSSDWKSLVGTLRTPDLSLISNNSGSLISDAGAGLTGVGGGAFFRWNRHVLAVDSSALANAQVTLVREDGVAVSTESVTTDSQGRYAFQYVPPIEGAFFVQADFKHSNQDFTFSALVPTQAATETVASIDAATTLVAEKGRSLLKKGSLSRTSIPGDKLAALLERTRAVMVPGVVPFMARQSKDLVPALDQLFADNAELRQVAADLAPAVADPLETWRVSTLYDKANLVALGLLPSNGQGVLLDFEVDAAGNFYTAMNDSGSNIRSKIVKVTREGAVTTVARLPVAQPIKLCFAPNGALYAAGMIPDLQRVVVCRVAETVTVLPGYMMQLNQTGVNEGVAGRMAVDAAGNIYGAFRNQHVIVRLIAGRTEPEVFAGAPGQSGYKDGVGGGARFNKPMSLDLGPDGALYVADSGNTCIRRIATDGTVTTYAGKPGEATYRNGRGEYARFGTPEALAIDRDGNCLISDTQSRRLRRISRDGSVFLVAGSGVKGVVDGVGSAAAFDTPGLLTIDGQGRIYLLDMALLPGSVSPSSIFRVISRQ